MSSSDLAFQWFQLFQARGVGTRTLNAIRNRLVHAGLSIDDTRYLDWPTLQRVAPEIPHSAYEALRSDQGGGAHDDYERLRDRGIQVVHPEHHEYPTLVRERLGADAPSLLFCYGYLDLLNARNVAIVGSRHASVNGLDFASRLAGELALEGFNVISGYAAGVDTSAHLGALRNDGTTTMVLSDGIFHFRRKGEFRDVSWDGNVLAVSQFHPREKWLARHAMIRNKLVCALSSAVVVVESGARTDERGRMSGTFNAGEVALVMGVPLFVLSPDAVGGTIGNDMLIQKGGRSVTPRDACQTIVNSMAETTDPPMQPTAAGQQARLL